MPLIPRESLLKREQLVKGNAQGVDVGTGVDPAVLPGRLLGTHVAQRAEDVAGTGDVEFGLHPGESEVGHPGLAAGIDEQIWRLDISMDDAHFMGMM